MSLRSKNADRALAAALDCLAGSIRSGSSVRAALMSWHALVSDDLRPSLCRLQALIALGLSPEEAVVRAGEQDPALVELRGVLAPLLVLHGRKGGDLPGAVGAAATWLRERSDDLAEARVAAAGAKLSGRMVAALPLLFLPLTPLGRAPLFDLVGILLVVTGVAFALVGLRWIGSLVPSPSEPNDPLERFARSSALLLRGGLGFRHAFDAAATSVGTPLIDLGHRVILGLSWSGVLRDSSDPFLRRVGEIADRGERLGLSIAPDLMDVADERRRATERAFRAQLRRAPVLMMVPLTLCVLPSYGLLALGPFLRGLVNG